MTTQATTTTPVSEIYIPHTLGGSAGAVTAALTTLVDGSRPLVAEMQKLYSQYQNLSLSLTKNGAAAEVVGSSVGAIADGLGALSDFSGANATHQAASEQKALREEFYGEFDPENAGKIGKITRDDLELKCVNGDSMEIGNKGPEGFAPRDLSTDEIKSEKERFTSEYDFENEQIQKGLEATQGNCKGMGQLAAATGQIFQTAGKAEGSVLASSAGLMGATGREFSTTLGSLLQLLMGAINSNNSNAAYVAGVR